MSMYGAHMTTTDIRGRQQRHQWSHYGTWAGCFAGMAQGQCSHLRDDGTVIASIALASNNRNRQTRRSDIQTAQRAFLFGEFCQRLTNGAFLSWELPDHNTPLGATQQTWGNSAHVQGVMDSAHIVNFIPTMHQDLLVTAFRISGQVYKHGFVNNIAEEDWEFMALALALKNGDGWAYSDSSIIFGTPTAERVLEFVADKYDGDFDELYDDDIGDEFDGAEFTQLTEVGLGEMLKRTTQQFEGLCRQGMGPLICGYTKDVEMGSDEIKALRPDDPIGLAAPMRFTQRGGRRLKDLPIHELIGLIKEILRG